MPRIIKIILVSSLVLIAALWRGLFYALPILRSQFLNTFQLVYLTDSWDIDAETAQMANYDLPDTYAEIEVRKTPVSRTLTIVNNRGVGGLTITIFQSQIKFLTNSNPRRQNHYVKDGTVYEKVEEQTRVVAGQEVRFTTYELTREDQAAARLWMVSDPFIVKDCVIDIQITGTSRDWDAQGIELFLESIH